MLFMMLFPFSGQVRVKHFLPPNSLNSSRIHAMTFGWCFKTEPCHCQAVALTRVRIRLTDLFANERGHTTPAHSGRVRCVELGTDDSALRW